MKIFIPFFSLVTSLFTIAQDSTVDYYSKNGQIKGIIYHENGMLEGSYKSWYINGKQKAEGQFVKNQKVGVWKVWDDSGVLRVSRKYEHNYRYETLIANNENSEPLILKSRSIDSLHRDEQGLIEYYFVREKDVLVSQRSWRFIPMNKTNDIIFKDQLLFSIIKNGVEGSAGLNTYHPDYDQLNEEFERSEAIKMINDMSNELIGFKLKEDWWYDSNRQLSDIRIIAISPVVVNNVSKDTTNLFWIYYPELREILALNKVEIKGQDLIQNLDDVFYFKKFSSFIYRDLQFSDEPERILIPPSYNVIESSVKKEMRLLDLEMDAWISEL